MEKTKVTCGLTMSLDGFAAGHNQSFEKPFGDNLKLQREKLKYNANYNLKVYWIHFKPLVQLGKQNKDYM